MSTLPPLPRVPTRSYTNSADFHRWVDNPDEFHEPRKPALKDQIPGFDTYTLVHPKHATLSRINTGIQGGPTGNYILLKEGLFEVPLQWSEGKYTATQIIQGKRKLDVMRSQKLVLCQVEDAKNKWFEVGVLNDDLSYPFGAELIGLKTLLFSDYPSARKYYNRLIAKAGRGSPNE